MANARFNSTIIRPRVTEKASILTEGNVYAFEVKENATKLSVARDIVTLFKVTPLKVNIVNTPDKKKFVRGKKGSTSTPKKAYVFLKKGDTISIA